MSDSVKDTFDDGLATGFKQVSFEEWSEAATKGDEEIRLATTVEEGIDAKWLYTPDDRISDDPAGLPDRAPFVRGTRAGKPWHIRQVASTPGREDANANLLEDLNGGVTEIALRFDRAARTAATPGTAEFALGRGDDGVAISTLDDLSTVLEGVYLDMAAVSLEAGANFLPAAALLNAHWQANGIAPERALASFGADPLGTLAREGELPASPEVALAQAAELAREVDAALPKVRTLGVNTDVYLQAGASSAWELGIAIATAVEHLRSCDLAGLAPAAAARQIEFTLGIGPDQFLEMAKFRAARRLWARVLEECGVPAEDRHSATYGVTSARMITAVDPWVNMLRVTTATFAAGTGGADGVTVTPFDRALGEPGELGRRIARNTQIVLQEESSLGRIADPVAGSWYGEVLTDEIAQAAWKIFTEIESEGGALAALRSGLIVNALAEEADRREADLVHRRRLMTGINEFPLLGDDGTETKPADNDALARLDAARLAERPDISMLADLGNALPGERLMKSTAAATAGARIDEIAAAFAGETFSQPKLELRPDSLPIEILRTSVDNHIAAGGEPPRLFLASTGTIASHVALANWAKSFFEVGGIETVASGHLPDNDAQAAAFKAGGFKMAVVCAGRKETEEDIKDLVTRLRGAGAEYIYLPKPSPELEAAAGADESVREGVQMVEVLTAALKRLGVEVQSGGAVS